MPRLPKTAFAHVRSCWRPHCGGYHPPGPPRQAPPARAASLGARPPPRTPPTGASGAPEAP
eukprot:13478405-Alexandrium_andersonii.AAC.1